MGRATESVVIVQFDEDGDLHYFVSPDERVRLFIVDERAPHDRVYEWTSRDSRSVIAEVLGDSPIGHSKDERHAAIAYRLIGLIEGRAPFNIVENDR